LTTTICDQAERPTIFQQHHLSSEQSKTNSIEIERCSIRILKSAIYHAFRCQIALTLIVRQPPEGGDRRAASKQKTELGIGCVEASDLRETFSRSRDPSRSRSLALGTPATCVTVGLLVYPLRR